MGKASRRKQQRRHYEQLTIEGLPEHLKQDQVRVRRQHSGEKISDALLEVMKPFVESGMSTEQMRALAEFAVLAWNLSLQSRIDRQAVQHQFKHLSEEMQQATLGLLAQMIERKWQQYPDDRRAIASFQLHETDDGGWYVTAAAAAQPVVGEPRTEA